MTGRSSQRVKELFLRALDASEQERNALLERECQGDAELRSAVESLLRHANIAPARFLDPTKEANQAALSARAEASLSFAPGTEIGAYRVVRLLGEGGMGMVYEAHSTLRSESVAIKVIKPGMDSRSVIRRFQTEQATLQLLAHPNVASLLAVGALDSGLPYLVMELVEGNAITKFCDERSLGVRERIELCKQVARGLEHAHAHGIIHRDLKAGNVLVVDTDCGPQAKIVDFGIAKLLSATGTSSLTVEGRLLGTPESMSPEQVRGRQAVSVKSDVYSLGVLVYRLLCGRFPIDPERLAGLEPQELFDLKAAARITPPSARIDDPARAKQVRRELDWVVLKALEVDPEQRYPTTAEFADELDRWLHGEPVRVGPQSSWHRLRATLRQHRLVATCIAAVMAVTLTALIGVTWAWLQASAARSYEADARAQAEAINDFVQRELMAAAAPEALGLDAPLQLVLHDAIARFGSIFAERPQVEVGVRAMLGETLINCRRPDLAVMHWVRARELSLQCFGQEHAETLHAQAGLARAWTDLGLVEDARLLLEQTLGQAERHETENVELVLELQVQLGFAWALLGRAEGFESLRQAIESRRTHSGEGHPDYHDGLRKWALALMRAERFDESARGWEVLIAELAMTRGDDHPDALAARQNLGRARIGALRHEAALEPFRRVLEARAASLGARHPNTVRAREQLVEALEAAGRGDEATRQRESLTGASAERNQAGPGQADE